MKKLLFSLITILLLVGCSSPAAQKTDDELKAEGWVKDPLANGYVLAEEGTETTLPDPVDTTKTYKPSEDADPVACEAGVFSADCSSINASNLTEYLDLDDVLYIDLRDYSDYSQKHLRNFEVIPYFAYVFNADAGTDDSKIQLYGGSVDEPVANYEESDQLLEVLFPKDKTIFIMCQSGGRVAQLMKILNAKGYDMSKIYNVGGMGQFTDAAFKEYTTDTLEFKVEGVYAIEGLAKN